MTSTDGTVDANGNNVLKRPFGQAESTMLDVTSPSYQQLLMYSRRLAQVQNVQAVSAGYLPAAMPYSNSRAMPTLAHHTMSCSCLQCRPAVAGAQETVPNETSSADQPQVQSQIDNNPYVMNWLGNVNDKAVQETELAAGDVDDTQTSPVQRKVPSSPEPLPDTLPDGRTVPTLSSSGAPKAKRQRAVRSPKKTTRKPNAKQTTKRKVAAKSSAAEVSEEQNPSSLAHILNTPNNKADAQAEAQAEPEQPATSKTTAIQAASGIPASNVNSAYVTWSRSQGYANPRPSEFNFVFPSTCNLPSQPAYSLPSTVQSATPTPTGSYYMSNGPAHYAQSATTWQTANTAYNTATWQAGQGGPTTTYNASYNTRNAYNQNLGYANAAFSTNPQAVMQAAYNNHVLGRLALDRVKKLEKAVIDLTAEREALKVQVLNLMQRRPHASVATQTDSEA